jgi:hypothetical protein
MEQAFRFLLRLTQWDEKSARNRDNKQKDPNSRYPHSSSRFVLSLCLIVPCITFKKRRTPTRGRDVMTVAEEVRCCFIADTEQAQHSQPAPPWPPEVSDLGFGVRLSFIHARMQATHVSPIPPGQKSGAQVVTCQCHDYTLDKSPMAVTSRTPLTIPLSPSSVTFDSEAFQDLGRHTRITRGGRTYQDLSRMNG